MSTLTTSYILYPSTPTQSLHCASPHLLRVQRGQRLPPSRNRPHLSHSLRIPNTTALDDEADVYRTADIALEEVNARRIHKEVCELAGSERPERAVDSESDCCVCRCGAKDLWGMAGQQSRHSCRLLDLELAWEELSLLRSSSGLRAW